MPTNPYELPITVGRATSYKHTEQTAATGQTKLPDAYAANEPTGKATLSAQGHGCSKLMSKDVEEDSIIPILPFVQRDIVRGLAEGREDAILNGDTAGTHEDSDTTSAADRRKLWLGLRAEANDQSNTTDLGTLSLANLRVMRGAMGKYGVRPADLAFITSVAGYIKLLGLTEVTTVDKYGSQATVLTGELAKVDGIPVIVSEWARADLNASGVHDGATEDNTVIYLVNRSSYLIGERRRPNVQLLKELYAESDQDALVVRERVAFKKLFAAAEDTMHLGYNVAV
jgi:HK97 family phage major capsid protein